MKNRRLKLKVIRSTYVRIAWINSVEHYYFDTYSSNGFTYGGKCFGHLTNFGDYQFDTYRKAIIRHPELHFAVTTEAYGCQDDDYGPSFFKLGGGFYALHVRSRNGLSKFWKTFDRIKEETKQQKRKKHERKRQQRKAQY